MSESPLRESCLSKSVSACRRVALNLQHFNGGNEGRNQEKRKKKENFFRVIEPSESSRDKFQMTSNIISGLMYRLYTDQFMFHCFPVMSRSTWPLHVQPITVEDIVLKGTGDNLRPKT